MHYECEKNMNLKEPAKGRMLISEPFLYDPNFKRSVILLCEHNNEGSFGLVLNKKMDIRLEQVLPEMDMDVPVFQGGPVELNTLHFLHTVPDLFEDSTKVTEHIYWGGDFERLKFLASTKQLSHNNIRFFIGYSGWGEGQLKAEIGKNSWYITDGEINNFFLEDDEQYWRTVLEDMGGKFKVISNFPEDPSLN